MYLFYILGVYKKLEKIGKRKRKGFARAYDVGNPGPGLGQAQTCGRVKPVDGIPNLSF
jgi:hypothetical protein